MKRITGFYPDTGETISNDGISDTPVSG